MMCGQDVQSRRFIWLIRLVVICAMGLVPSVVQAQAFVVQKVVSADTLVLDNGDVVKLIGVSAPSLVLGGGALDRLSEKDRTIVGQMDEQSTEFLRTLLVGHRVTLQYDEQKNDALGRVLAYVYAFETFINASVLSAGYATPKAVAPNLKYTEFFEDLYDQARKEKRGLWK